MGRVGATIAAALALALGRPAWPQDTDEQAARKEDQKRDEKLDEDARRLAREQDKAARDMAESARELSREDGAPAARPAEEAQRARPGVQQLEGNVAKVRTGELVVLDPKTGELLELRVGRQTVIVRGNGPLALDRIREGSEVRASYVLEDGSLHAARVEVSEKSPQPAEIVQQKQGERPLVLRLQGRVTRVADAGDRFDLLDPQRDLSVTLKVADSTRLTRDGQPVGFESLEPGLEVRALYTVEKSNLVATEVAILAGPAKKSAPGGQPTGKK